MTALAQLMVFASAVLPVCAQQVSQEALAAHAQTAQAAERRNDFPTAVHEYEYVAAQLPQNAEMQSNLGVALYFNHELMRAIGVFRKAIALNANLLAPHLFSGLAWYRLSNPDAAVPELEKAVRMNDSDLIAHTWLGYAYTAQLRYDLALKEFQAASRLDPNDVDVWYALGQTYLQIGRDATLRLLAVAPDGGRTWQLAGEQSQLQGNRRQARDNFEGALSRRPDIPELRTVVAEMGGTVPAASAKRGDTAREDDFYGQAHEAERQARAAFERVAQIAPGSYRAHQIMGDALTAEQRLDEANEEYRIVLEIKPDLPGVHETIGKNLLRNGKLPEALKEFEAEVQLQPRSASARANVGEILLLMGRDTEAAQALTEALDMNRPPPKVYRLLGKLDLRRKEYGAAAIALKHYLSMDKDDSTAYFLLAKAYQGLGENQQMENAFALYRKTSQDSKARSGAQRELESFNNPDKASEETAGLKHNAGH